MKSGKHIIVDFLEGIRRDSIEDLHAKNISQGDLGLKTKAEDDGGELSGNHYWYFLVNGRKPGKRPPIDSILGWLQKKGITADIPLRSLAFLIARKIGKLGTDIYLGRRPGLALPQIIEVRTKDFRKDLREHYREEIKKEVGDQLRKIFAA
jgi:hypothetical protein